VAAVADDLTAGNIHFTGMVAAVADDLTAGNIHFTGMEGSILCLLKWPSTFFFFCFFFFFLVHRAAVSSEWKTPHIFAGGWGVRAQRSLSPSSL